MDASKQVLVVYYSLSGNTARVARDLAARMNADIESIRDTEHGVGLWGYLKDAWDAMRNVSARIGDTTRDPADYALTIVGTPVWAHKMTPAIRAYLQRARGKLSDVAFFVTSGDTEASKVVPSMEALVERNASGILGFNARELEDEALYEDKLSSFVRAIEHSHRGTQPASGTAVGGRVQSR